MLHPIDKIHPLLVRLIGRVTEKPLQPGRLREGNGPLPQIPRATSLTAALCGLLAMSFPLSSAAQRFLFPDASKGLGNYNIQTIAQDAQGYLWAGTENGLYRHDGFHLQLVGADQGMHSASIHALFAAPDATLWIGAANGLFFRSADGSFHEVLKNPGVGHFSIGRGTVFAPLSPTQIAVNDRNSAWILVKTGVEQWKPATQLLPAEQIFGLLQDSQHSLWLGCGTSLCRIAAGKDFRPSDAWRLPADHWNYIAEDGNHHLWLRGDRNLIELDPATGSFMPRNLPGIRDESASPGLTVDQQGQVIAWDGATFGIWQKDHWRSIGPAEGLEPLAITSVFRDQSGALWLSQSGHGLRRWAGEDHWEAYTRAEGLDSDIVHVSLRDQQGRLWVGTDAGLNWIDPQSRIARPWNLAHQPAHRVVALAMTRDGSIWAGSANGTLFCIEPKSLRSRSWQLSPIHRLLADTQNTLWIATDTGIYSVSPKSSLRQASNPEPQLPPGKQRFTDLSQDSSGALWAIGENGMERFDQQHWQHIDAGLRELKAEHIVADGKNSVWASTSNGGVLRLQINNNRVSASEWIDGPPLLSGQILSLFTDHRGWLWLGQDRGITVFTGTSWRSFTQESGLIWNDCQASAIAEDKDGSMWFGTSGGLAHLRLPDQLLQLQPPQLSVSEASLGSRLFADGAAIPWSRGALQIDFAARLNSQSGPSAVRYRLVGIDSGWNRSAEALARYTQLPPGSYRLEAIGVDTNGFSLTRPVDLTFQILPRWWRSGFLYLLGAIGAFLLLRLLGVALATLRVARSRHASEEIHKQTEKLKQERMALQRAHANIRHLAEYDDLTGLWNRRAILDRLHGELDRSHRHSVCISILRIDLDRFQEINENFGPTTGDRIIQEVSRILLRAVRTYDWVGRFGGNEFLVILPGSDQAAAQLRAEQIRRLLAQPHTFEFSAQLQISASFGVTTANGSDCEQLLESAGQALRRAKSRGGNCVEFQPVEMLKCVEI
jgi:diguanylate cyclase (GGDEF)-like protein